LKGLMIASIFFMESSHGGTDAPGVPPREVAPE
jgi:hypothetical protein